MANGSVPEPAQERKAAWTSPPECCRCSRARVARIEKCRSSRAWWRS